MRKYFNNHTHTIYSNVRLLDAINRPKDLIKKAHELGMSGIAITDHEILSAHVEALKIAEEIYKEDPDFLVALGNEIYLTDTRDNGQKYYHFILIAKDAIGHKALRELSSHSWFCSYVDRGLERVPTLKMELDEIVHKYPGHLIATTACIGGELGTNLLLRGKALAVGDAYNAQNYTEKIDEFLQWCYNLFGNDFYIECAPSSNEDQILVNKQAYEFITQNLLGATVNVNYYIPDDTYQYAKITYKQNTSPIDQNDGDSVDIDPTLSSVNIKGLEEEKTYWFIIFTDKSESEAFPFLVPELIDYGNMIFNDNSEITVVNNNSSVTAITTPKFLVDTYKEKSTQSGYSYMNANANTWLIGPSNKTTGYYHIFGWTLPTDKDIYIICQNGTGQNAYYVWIWWDGLTSRDMLGTNCGYSKWFVVSGSVIYYESGTALNNYSGFSNNLTIDGNRYWSQTWLGGDSSLKPIVWTEVNTSRIWVNGKKLT